MTSGSEEHASMGAHEELALAREEVLREHPDVVPELVDGATIAELLASVERARAAYARASERVRADAATTAPAQPPVVSPRPASTLADPAALTPMELIRRGAAERRKAERRTEG